MLLFVVPVSGYGFRLDIVPLFAQFFVAVVAVAVFHNVVAVGVFHNVVAGSIGDRHRSLFCRFFLSFPITLIFLFCLILSSSCSPHPTPHPHTPPQPQQMITQSVLEELKAKTAEKSGTAARFHRLSIISSVFTADQDEVLIPNISQSQVNSLPLPSPSSFIAKHRP